VLVSLVAAYGEPEERSVGFPEFGPRIQPVRRGPPEDGWIANPHRTGPPLSTLFVTVKVTRSPGATTRFDGVTSTTVSASQVVPDSSIVML
jgi:hypothetical protein